MSSLYCVWQGRRKEIFWEVLNLGGFRLNLGIFLCIHFGSFNPETPLNMVYGLRDGATEAVQP